MLQLSQIVLQMAKEGQSPFPRCFPSVRFHINSLQMSLGAGKKALISAEQLYFFTPKNLYDMLSVMPNFGRGSRISTVYPGISTDLTSYYKVDVYKPDIGLHFVSDTNDPERMKLTQYVCGMLDRHKGINPEWFACLPWKTIRFASLALEKEEAQFESFMQDKLSWEEFFGSIKFAQ